MAKTKKVEDTVVETPKVSEKELVVNLLKAKVAGLFDREPQPGMSDVKLSQLAEEIIALLA